MKYIKTYDMRYHMNKKTVDYNKIYVFGDGNVGKIITNPGDGFRDVGCKFIGYDEEGEEFAHIIKYGAWENVREASPEEIERYEILYNSNKYNL